MPRIRSVKPEYWTEAPIMALSRDARLLLIGLSNFADDNGVIPRVATAIKAKIFPEDRDMTPRYVEALLDELGAGGLLGTYQVDGKALLVILGFNTDGSPLSQKIKNRATRYPEPCNVKAFGQTFLIPPGALREASPPDRIGRDRSTVSIRIETNADAPGPEGQGPKDQNPVGLLDAGQTAHLGAEPQEIPPPPAVPALSPDVALWRMVETGSDYGRLLFGPGLQFVIRLTGMPPDRARRLIGDWLQKAGRTNAGQDFHRVWDLLAQAQTEQVADLRSWMPACLIPKDERARAQNPSVLASIAARGPMTAYQRDLNGWIERDDGSPRPRLEDYTEEKSA